MWEMRFSRRARSVALAYWIAGCAGAPADREPTFVDLAGDGPASSAVANGSGSSQGSGSPVNGLPTDSAPVEQGGRCTKVDFLFVVDNSLSMLEEQTALVKSFPGFMTVVEQTLGAGDFHVMVVDTDASDVRDAISALLGQSTDACGPTLGAGRRQSQSGQDCGLEGDRRYLDSSQVGLETAFSCIAEVGTLGNPLEAPVDAMLASIGPSLVGPGGCNEDFLRDDAILVVTLIGDEDDGVSSGEPAVWRDSLVQAKGGSDTSIVFLGLIGGEPTAGASVSCADGESPDPAPRLQSLIRSFSYGTVGDICAADYAPFFAQAVSVIDTACDDFTPIIR
jgi:hypothetical protein